MDARGAGPAEAAPPPGSAVYDSCTESEPPGSKESSLRGGSAFGRGRRSREGSLRAGRAFFAAGPYPEPGNPGPHEEKGERVRSLGALLTEAAAMLRHAGRFPARPDPPRQASGRLELPPRSGTPGSHPSSPAAATGSGAGAGGSSGGGGVPRRAASEAPANLWLQPGGSSASAPTRADADAHASKGPGPGLGLAPAMAVLPPQPAGAPAADLASPPGAAPTLLSTVRSATTPGTSLSRSDAQSTGGTSESRVGSLSSIVSALTSAPSDPLAGGPVGTWPLAHGVVGGPAAAGPTACSSAEASVTAAATAAPHWHQVAAPPAWVAYMTSHVVGPVAVTAPL